MDRTYWLSDATDARPLTTADERQAAHELAQGQHSLGDVLLVPTVEVCGLFVGDDLVAVAGGRTVITRGIRYWSIDVMATRIGYEGRKYMTDLRSWLVIEGPAWEHAQGRIGGVVDTEAGLAFSRAHKEVDDAQTICELHEGQYRLISGTLHQILTHPDAHPQWVEWFKQHRPEVLEEA